MKRTYTLCIITSLIMCILAVGVHRVTRTEEKHLKVGFIFVGDEITPYTENFIKARNHVMEVYGDQIECVTKYNVTEDRIEEPLQELVAEKCDYIIAASCGNWTEPVPDWHCPPSEHKTGSQDAPAPLLSQPDHNHNWLR